MNEQSSSGGVSYKQVGADYFEKRGLKRYAKVWSLWALGVGAVISGHYSGWNFGLANGFGSMLVALFIIAAMYWGLIFSLAEMSPALPHTGAAYSFARSAMGPWGGMFTGLAESIEYILTPAVIVFFIGSYLGAIFETGPQIQPVWWLGLLHRVPAAQPVRRGAVVPRVGARHRRGAADPRGVLGERAFPRSTSIAGR